MDVFLSSTTTAATAHKLGAAAVALKRNPSPVLMWPNRMNQVIAGEKGGISKKTGKVGGGECHYVEKK